MTLITAMLTPEVVEAILKTETGHVPILLALRATCRAFRDVITGHMPNSMYCRFTPRPDRLLVSTLL